MPKQRIQRVADKIRGENSDREPASPFSSSRKSNCRETTRHSDRCHQRDRRAASDFLELNACLWLQAPDRFQKTSGKGQCEHGNETNQRSSREEDYEQNSGNRSI